MKLYHVSNKEYNIGDTITLLPDENALYYESADSLQRDAINRFDKYIDAYYPTYLHRRNALFAFDNPQYAFWFNPEGYIYEVEMKVSYKGPFVLVTTLMQFIDNKNKADAILKEYYSPDYSIDKTEWYAFEYLGDEMTIIQKIDYETIKDSFSADNDKSERLFGTARKGTRGLIC